jgi:glycosyltransferase involved in cell wall biosynthesis
MDDATILVSEAVRRGLPPRFQERGRVIVHGLPLDRVRRFRDDRAEMRRRFGIEDGELVVGTVANLRPQKRYPDLLRAARQVVAAGLPVRFLAAGQGPCEGEIRSLHAELGLGDRFRLLGYLPEPAQMLAACDVFVLTSAYEGLPLAIMEALTLGLPVVATDAPGINEAVRDGVEAVLVPPGRPDLIADALIRVLTDDRRRALMASAALERSSEFDVGEAVRHIEDIYREVIERRTDRQLMPRGTRPRMRRK